MVSLAAAAVQLIDVGDELEVWSSEKGMLRDTPASPRHGMKPLSPELNKNRIP